MDKRKAVAVPAMIIGVVVALVVVVVVWTRGGTPVAKDAAVDDFRRTTTTETEAEGPTGEDGPEVGASPLIPGAGVYSYASAGNQEVKFGPLPADPRILPEEVVAGVSHVPVPVGADGKATVPSGPAASNCYDFDLKIFTEHSESMTTCVEWVDEAEGTTRAVIAEHLILMKMGPVTATAHLECEQRLVMQPETNQSGVPCLLRLTGAPVEVSADLVGSVSVGDPEEIDVDGTKVMAVPVTLAYDANGKVSGSWAETVWMSSDNWLPIRFDRNIDLLGPATIIEKSELTLKSLLPET